MTIRTTIPYQNGQQFAPSIGPTFCDRCKRSLIDRSPDAKEDSVDHATNAELVLYVWESEVDAQGHPICGTCAEDEEQAAAYLELAKWRGRAENRGYYSGRGGLTVYEGQIAGPTFETVRGKLVASTVLAFTQADPLRKVTNAQIVARLERLADETKAVETAKKLTGAELGAHNYAAMRNRAEQVMGHTWNDADELELNEDCPETERNCER